MFRSKAKVPDKKDPKRDDGKAKPDKKSDSLKKAPSPIKTLPVTPPLPSSGGSSTSMPAHTTTTAAAAKPLPATPGATVTRPPPPLGVTRNALPAAYSAGAGLPLTQARSGTVGLVVAVPPRPHAITTAARQQGGLVPVPPRPHGATAAASSSTKAVTGASRQGQLAVPAGPQAATKRSSLLGPLPATQLAAALRDDEFAYFHDDDPLGALPLPIKSEPLL